MRRILPVLDVISLPGERARLGDLPAAAPGTCWDRLLFSAKESVYKAWFPLTRRWLGFEDADITINPADETFEAQLLVAAPAVGGSPLAGFTGRWQFTEAFGFVPNGPLRLPSLHRSLLSAGSPSGNAPPMPETC
jgi:4'-phosphopantetheinyl transferase EntD